MSEIIHSTALGREPTRLGAEAGKLDLYDGLKTPISEDVILLSVEHIQQIEDFAALAATHFGPRVGAKEPTFVQTELGLPALITRVDCTIENGEIVAYEMEDSPSGQGITDKLQRSIGGQGIRHMLHAHYAASVGQLPHVIVSGARSHGTDDQLIVGPENYTYDTVGDLTVAADQLVIVKTIPGDPRSAEPYAHLQPRALAPLMSEGDKTYLERLGNLRVIHSAEDLLRTAENELASQVVKSRLGSMAMGISLYLHPQDRKIFGKKGLVTASRLASDAKRFIQEREGALVQRFVPPIQLDNPEGRNNAILRIFTLLENQGGTIQAKAIGGCYVARPELIVHGASNAVAGAIVIPEREVAC